ncbi:MAG: hypothetical protein NTZ46_00315 [Verrucomicrobia bacterium]|nr:hypothetical protein [Verrucomicrobiota bacterium]
MKKSFLLACTACLFPSLSGYCLDLTPRFVTRITRAQSENMPYFVEGDTRYSMELPLGVTASRGEGAAAFHFRDLDGTLTMKPSPFKPDEPFSGSALDAYRKVALGFVPAGATDISIKAEAPNPLTFHGWTSHRFTVAYQLPGRSHLQSVTFLNFSAKQQILLISDAPTNEFERVERLVMDIMGAWRTLRPGESIAVPPPL